MKDQPLFIYRDSYGRTIATFGGDEKFEVRIGGLNLHAEPGEDGMIKIGCSLDIAVSPLSEIQFVGKDQDASRRA